MPYHYPSTATPPSHPSSRLLCIYLIRFLVRVLSILLLLLCGDVPFRKREFDGLGSQEFDCGNLLCCRGHYNLWTVDEEKLLLVL